MSVAAWYGAALVAALVVAVVAGAWRYDVVGRIGLCVLAACEGVLAGCGFLAVLGHPWSLPLGRTLGFTTALGADPLAGLWLALSGVVAVAACLVAASPARQREGPPNRAVAVSALMLVAVAVTITATDVFVLVLAWELLSFTFYVLGGYRGDSEANRTGLVAYAFGKSSGAALLVGLLLLAAGSGQLRLAGIAAGAGPVAHAAAYVLLLFAFGVKVGLVPVHVWMPATYESAPAGVRALMAGVAVNAGFYGLWRTVDLLRAPPIWLVVVLLLLAGLTALLGIAHAAVQVRLPRVVAWSSVENAGLIVVGLGVGMVGLRVGQPKLVAAGLLAATLQAVTHAFAKALLFSTTGTFEAAAGSGHLGRLRGAAWRSPYSGVGFAIGAVTLAALPPTVGFASEWFLLEALMQQFRVGGLLLPLTLAVTGALVALTTGFAGVTFVRLVGFVALGRRPRRQSGRSRDIGVLGMIGLGILAFGCLGIAAFSPIEINVLARGLGTVVPAGVTARALQGPWVIQPVFAGFSSLSPSWLWVTMPLFMLAVWLMAVVFSGGRISRVRRVAPWRSASGDVVGDPSYTAFAYANPTRKVLANVLLTRTQLVEFEHASGEGGEDSRPRPPGAHLTHSSDVVEVVEQFVYRPLLRPTLALVHAAKALQSGRLGGYVAYMLLALVAVVALATSLT